jgi:hypothetical protein
MLFPKIAVHERGTIVEHDASLDRALGRVEGRVADLAGQIEAMRVELSTLAHNVETAVAAHRERIASLEAFRHWAVGVMTGLFLSGMAAVFGWIVK